MSAMGYSKLPATAHIILYVVLPIVGLLALTGGMIYYGGQMMRKPHGVVKADVYVDGSTVVITNINEIAWSAGRAYLDDDYGSYDVADFVGVQPGAQIRLPFADFNDFKNAKSVKELPVSMVTIEAEGFGTRTYRIEKMIKNTDP